MDIHQWRKHHTKNLPIYLIAWGSIVILFLHFLYVTTTYTVDWGLRHDQAILRYIAWNILEGAIPYKELFDVNMPGTYLLHIAAMQLIGYGNSEWRVFSLLWLALTAGAMALFSKKQGLLTIVVTMVFFASMHLYRGEITMGHRDFLLVVFTILGAHFAANIIEGKWQTASALLSGSLAVCACWIKPISVLYILFILGSLLFYKVPLRFIILLCIGTLIPSIPIVSWLYLSGGLWDWLDIMFNYTLPIYSKLNSGIFWDKIFGKAFPFVAVLLPFLIFPLRFSPRVILAILGVLYGLLHALLQGKGWPVHYIPFIAWFCIFACYRIGDNLNGSTSYTLRFAVAIFIALSSVMIGKIYIHNVNYSDWKPDQKMIEDVKKYSTDNNEIFVFDTAGAGKHILYKLRKKIPTRFVYDYPLYNMVEKEYVKNLIAEFLRDVKRTMPKAIFVTWHTFPGYKGGVYRLNRVKEIKQFLDQYYLPPKQKGYLLYVRK